MLAGGATPYGVLIEGMLTKRACARQPNEQGSTITPSTTTTERNKYRNGHQRFDKDFMRIPWHAHHRRNADAFKITPRQSHRRLIHICIP